MDNKVDTRVAVTVRSIKKHNRNAVYRLLKQEGSLSKQSIVSTLGLSLPTVTTNINDLIEEGLVIESGSAGSEVGRRASTFSITKDKKLAIGIDITKNHITLVIVNLAGEILGRKRVRKSFMLKDSYFQYVGELVEGEVRENGIDSKQILGVGIGIPGLVTLDEREVFYGQTMTNFTGLKIESFTKHIQYPCLLINDANAACLAETWIRPALKNVFYISLSNYVGGSIRLYDKAYTGEGPRSGEVGHITIVPNGLQCYCGQKGCVDPYCRGLRLSEHTDENLDLFFSKLEQGDEKFQEVFDEYLYHLSLAVNNTRMLFDCTIILGGYVGAYLEKHFDKLQRLLIERNTFEDNADYVEICQWRKDPIAAGAAIVFIQRFIDGI